MGRAFVAKPIWDGCPVVIVAGGASVTTAQVRLIGMARAKDVLRVIAVNDAVYLCWFADIAYACDDKWWRFHGPLRRFAGRKISMDETPVDDVDRIRSSGPNGFDDDPSRIRSGGNSGYQALHLAKHLGASRAVLVGFDMRPNGHWFGNHPPKVARASTPLYPRRIALFAGLAEELAKRGMPVVNATPGSALTAFPFVDLREELERIEAAHEEA